MIIFANLLYAVTVNKDKLFIKQREKQKPTKSYLHTYSQTDTQTALEESREDSNDIKTFEQADINIREKFIVKIFLKMYFFLKIMVYRE